jgi:hypothetical protein
MSNIDTPPLKKSILHLIRHESNNFVQDTIIFDPVNKAFIPSLSLSDRRKYTFKDENTLIVSYISDDIVLVYNIKDPSNIQVTHYFIVKDASDVTYENGHLFVNHKDSSNSLKLSIFTF